MAQEDVFKKLVSHCKEYGFVFPSSEIYDGLGAVVLVAEYGAFARKHCRYRFCNLYAPYNMESFWTR